MPADVVDLFLARAAQAPDRPAIVSMEGSLSYGALERRVRAFAAEFSKREAPKVLIALPPSADAYACMFAAGLAGGVYTPLNMAAPAEKMNRIVRQLMPDIIVAAADVLDRLIAAVPDAIQLGPPRSIQANSSKALEHAIRSRMCCLRRGLPASQRAS